MENEKMGIRNMGEQPIFERIKHLNEIGQEYWSARELFEVLEYLKWDKFLNVIDKAKKACQNSGQEPEDHFPRVEKMVKIGSGAKRDIGDIHLSRYACYLIIQKANQTHFEVGQKVRQTIKELGGTMPEDLPKEESIKKIIKGESGKLKGISKKQ